jgi:hypothetical protein
MKANLYLHHETFRHNNVDSEQRVTEKLQELVHDMASICYSKEYKQNNKFFYTPDLLTCNVFENQTLMEFVNKHLSNDQIGEFYTLLENSADDISLSTTLEELREMCKFQKDEQEVNSLVVLNHPSVTKVSNPYITFEDYELVYSRGSWLMLRRQILGNHPGTPSEFIEDCRKYFENLKFSEFCKTSLSTDFEYLQIVPRKIVYYLTCLNDGYQEVYDKHQSQKAKDLNSVVEDFSGVYGLDKVGSRKGKSTDKKTLTFNFSNDQTYYCEAHLKFNSPDSNFSGSIQLSLFNPRIYYYPNLTKSNGIIYVGSIGKHL